MPSYIVTLRIAVTTFGLASLWRHGAGNTDVCRSLEQEIEPCEAGMNLSIHLAALSMAECTKRVLVCCWTKALRKCRHGQLL